MYAGFITPKRVIKKVGIHQRLDTAAYHMIKQYLPDETFPSLKDILHFEGYNGPDGIKSKTGLKPRGKDDPGLSHLYDPATDTGEVPLHVTNHYQALVKCLMADDTIRAAFEAAWLAHYIGDGLTPAHHWPLEEKIAEAAEKARKNISGGDTGKYTAFLKKNWAVWGAKGHLSTHFNFELGIAFALLIFPIRPEFDDYELARARQLGPVEYFKSEARAIASLDLYERFYREGWNNDIAITVKNILAPRTARAIGMIWLLALLEAGQQLATTQMEAVSAPVTEADASA
jgi:hypothetical protein